MTYKRTLGWKRKLRRLTKGLQEKLMDTGELTEVHSDRLTERHLVRWELGELSEGRFE